MKRATFAVAAFSLWSCALSGCDSAPSADPPVASQRAAASQPVALVTPATVIPTLAPAATPSPASAGVQSQIDELRESQQKAEEKREDEATAAREREDKRRQDIEYHQGKIRDLESERDGLIRSQADNASPDVVQQEIDSKTSAIRQERDSIDVIQSQR